MVIYFDLIRFLKCFFSAAQSNLRCSCDVPAMFLRCSCAAGAVLFGEAYTGSSILQHGNCSPIPPAMLLGCCYATCTDAELYSLWRGVVFTYAYVFVQTNSLILALLTMLSCARTKNTSPHSEAAAQHDGTVV